MFYSSKHRRGVCILSFSRGGELRGRNSRVVSDAWRLVLIFEGANREFQAHGWRPWAKYTLGSWHVRSLEICLNWCKAKTISKDSFLKSETGPVLGIQKRPQNLQAQNQFDFVSNRQVDTNLAPVFDFQNRTSFLIRFSFYQSTLCNGTDAVSKPQIIKHKQSSLPHSLKQAHSVQTLNWWCSHLVCATANSFQLLKSRFARHSDLGQPCVQLPPSNLEKRLRKYIPTLKFEVFFSHYVVVKIRVAFFSDIELIECYRWTLEMSERSKTAVQYGVKKRLDDSQTKSTDSETERLQNKKIKNQTSRWLRWRHSERSVHLVHKNELIQQKVQLFCSRIKKNEANVSYRIAKEAVWRRCTGGILAHLWILLFSFFKLTRVMLLQVLPFQPVWSKTFSSQRRTSRWQQSNWAQTSNFIVSFYVRFFPCGCKLFQKSQPATKADRLETQQRHNNTPHRTSSKIASWFIEFFQYDPIPVRSPVRCANFLAFCHASDCNMSCVFFAADSLSEALCRLVKIFPEAAKLILFWSCFWTSKWDPHFRSIPVLISQVEKQVKNNELYLFTSDVFGTSMSYFCLLQFVPCSLGLMALGTSYSLWPHHEVHLVSSWKANWGLLNNS